MTNYALLTILQGACDNCGVGEIRYSPSLETRLDPSQMHWIESHSYQVAKEKATRAMQNGDWLDVRWKWRLINEENHTAFVSNCQKIPGFSKEMVIDPTVSMHGEVHFNVFIRFDGYTSVQKDQLVNRILETRIHLQTEALGYGYINKEMIRKEFNLGPENKEELLNEERETIARNLSFHVETQV